MFICSKKEEYRPTCSTKLASECSPKSAKYDEKLEFPRGHEGEAAGDFRAEHKQQAHGGAPRGGQPKRLPPKDGGKLKNFKKLIYDDA